MGLGDFVKGALHDVGNIASDIGGAAVNTVKAGEFAVTHLDDAARGIGKGLEFAGEHAGEFVGGAVKGTAFLATHPQYWDDAAKAMIKDQLKPQNLLINAGLLAATVATGGLAGVGLGAKIAEGAAEVGEVGKTVETGVEVAKAAKTASEVGEAAKVGRFGKFMNEARDIRSGISEARGMEKVDRLMSAAGDLKGAAKESVGLNRVSMVQRARTGLAERLLPGVEEGTAGNIQKAAFRQIEGGYGQAREAASTPWSRASSRINWAQSQLQKPQQAMTSLHHFSQGVQFAANPEGTAMKWGEQALTKAEGTSWGQRAEGVVKDAAKDMFGGNKPARGPQQRAYEPLVQPGMTTSPTSFSAPQTANTAVSARGTTAPGSVTTVGDSGPAMPMGPSNWYGPQGGYNAGRGFTPTGAVPGTTLGTHSATGAMV